MASHNYWSKEQTANMMPVWIRYLSRLKGDKDSVSIFSKNLRAFQDSRAVPNLHTRDSSAVSTDSTRGGSSSRRVNFQGKEAKDLVSSDTILDR